MVHSGIVGGWIVFGAFVAVMVLYVFVIKLLLSRRTNQILNRFKGKSLLLLEPGANFFGQSSLGPWQIRGNGVLIVMPQEIYFEMWYPKKIFRIPITSVISVDTTKIHLGKTKARRLLRVVFTNSSGQEDSMAWLVKDPDRCKKVLESLLAH